MFSDATANNRETVDDEGRKRGGARHVAIKIDSVNWKMFVVGGAVACVAAWHPTVLVFDPSTIRSVVFVGGASAIIGGIRLRRRYRCYIDKKVQDIIAQSR
jgi:hypothetical protein